MNDQSFVYILTNRANTVLYTAIEREKQIKAGSRADKLALINKFNPEWKDLYDSI